MRHNKIIAILAVILLITVGITATATYSYFTSENQAVIPKAIIHYDDQGTIQGTTAPATTKAPDNTLLIVHFYKPTAYTAAYFYSWSGVSGTWSFPGTQMAPEGSGWYGLTVTRSSPGSTVSFNFNQGDNVRQTGNLNTTLDEIWYYNGTIYAAKPAVS